jgi:hypothetical protein
LPVLVCRETIGTLDETGLPLARRQPETAALYLSHPTTRYQAQGEISMTRHTVRASELLAATAFALTMLTTASFAYTGQQEQLCMGDAMRLCGEYIPDVDRITACMTQKYSSLSDGCKSVFEAPTAAPQAAPAAPVNYAPSTRPSKPLNIKPNLKKG